MTRLVIVVVIAAATSACFGRVCTRTPTEMKYIDGTVAVWMVDSCHPRLVLRWK